jgi:hypothetical protein
VTAQLAIHIKNGEEPRVFVFRKIIKVTTIEPGTVVMLPTAKGPIYLLVINIQPTIQGIVGEKQDVSTTTLLLKGSEENIPYEMNEKNERPILFRTTKKERLDFMAICEILARNNLQNLIEVKGFGFKGYDVANSEMKSSNDFGKIINLSDFYK